MSSKETRPRDDHGRFIATADGDIIDAKIIEGADWPSAELATIQPYAPPFWEERAWNLADRAEDDQYTLISLRHGLVAALVGQVDRLEEQDPPGHSQRRLASAAVFYFDADISNRAADLLP